MGKQWKQLQTLFFELQNHCRWWLYHKIKRCSLLGRKVMTNLDGILKSRDITLPTKVHLFKAMVFPVVKYGCESWTKKKVECRRIDAFELWCWRRFWAYLGQQEIQPVHPKGNQSWIFLGRTEAKAETPLLWPMMWRTDSLEKALMLGMIEGRRKVDSGGWDGWMASPTLWTWVWVSSGSWWWTGRPGMLQSMGSNESDMTEQLNWTEYMSCIIIYLQLF